MAHTKSQGSVKTNKDSISKRLGVKAFAGEKVISGNILVRQKGTRFHSGRGTDAGRDFTIFATADGIVKFRTSRGKTLIEVT